MAEPEKCDLNALVETRRLDLKVPDLQWKTLAAVEVRALWLMLAVDVEHVSVTTTAATTERTRRRRAPGGFKSAALDIQRGVEERGRHVVAETAPCRKGLSMSEGEEATWQDSLRAAGWLG